MFSTEPLLSTTHTHANFCASKTRTSLSRELIEKSLTLGRLSYLLDINCGVRKRAKLKEKIERTREVISGKQRKSRRAFWVRKIN